ALLLTASDDCTARVWDGATGRFMMVMRGYDGPITGAAWHPRGGHAATWGEGGAAVVWDTVTGEPHATLTRDQGSVRDGAWSPGGERLLPASSDGTARLWDPTALGLVTYRGHRARGVRAASFHPSDARRALTASADGAVHAWDPTTGTLTRE